jgi:ATP-binding cassette, subfamily C (CFTR/MRP), member 1
LPLWLILNAGIKLLGWQSVYFSRLNELRNDKELKTLQDFGIAQALATIIWSTSPFFVSCSSFVVFVLTQQTPLSAEIVFPALSLFNLLNFPLTVVPMVISAITEAAVAMNRMKVFLTADEVQPDVVTWHLSPGNEGAVITIQDSVFSWDQDLNRPSLRIDDYAVSGKSFCCVVGPVGSGKSTLLQAMLGDVWKMKGVIQIWGSIAYVAQTPWIITGSVKDNIVFGLDWDAELYSNIIKACALEDDLSTFSDGDDTQVGGQGITLSGGQKARLTLARALYARADIYLLDDCLSAVDQHVGRHIIDHVLGPNGLLRERTRVMATNDIRVLKYADSIVALKDGSIVEQGTSKDVLSSDGAIAELVRKYRGGDNPDSGDDRREARGTAETPSETTVESDPESSTTTNTTSGHPVLSGRNPPLRAPRERFPPLDISKSRDEEAGLTDVEKPEGAQWATYARYAKACGQIGIFVFFVMLILSQVASAGTNIWIKFWAEANERYGSNVQAGLYIGVYLGFGLGSAALTVVQDLILWVFCSIKVLAVLVILNSTAKIQIGSEGNA